MTNNAKLRDQARVLEQKENWREAIAVLRQVLEHPGGESDIGLWNRVGDLHVRLSETEKAVEAYEAAVNAYAESGLHNNAIALCRKVLRLVPGRASVYLKLGQISAAKGFLADARQNFLEYAERMQRAGKIDASFDALKEFADLSPGDTDVRRLLADQLLSHGRASEAVEQFRVLIGQAEAEGAAAVAEELRQQILAVDPDADTSGITRAEAASGHDDFHAAFALDPVEPAAPAAPPPAPKGLETTTAPEISLGEITPLEGFESTQLDVPATPPPAPATGADEGGLSLDFHIEPLDLGPAAEEEEAEPLPLHDFGDPADGEDAGEPLPLMDAGDFGGGSAGIAPLEGLDTGFGAFADEDQDDGEPLPLMDFAAEPTPRPASDGVAELRARFAAAPEDGGSRGALVAALTERGLAYEAESLLDEAHRDLSASGRYPEAYDVVSSLLELRPSDSALLQKRVEYAFRANDRARLVPAYLSLGEHLLGTGETSKGQAVFKRVLELDPENPRARAVVPVSSPPRQAAPAPAAPPPPAPAAVPSSEYVDLNALILDEVRGEQSTRFVVEEKEPTGDEDRDFADMLQHFRQKVSENIEVEDSASHYDLGVAFKEMGLLDEAVAEFQVALRGGSNPLATLEMLGQCFVEKGQLAVATRVLDRALRITGAAEGELIGVLYQLGRTEEAMGHPDAALDYYERVLAIDIRFRDAVRRAEALRTARGA